MKVHIVAPSFAGKSTAHGQRLSFDLEEHPEYTKRGEALDWAIESGRNIRSQYYKVAYQAAIKSNFPIISTHPSSDNTSPRRMVAVVKVPDWDMIEEGDKPDRYVACAMGYAKIALAVAKHDELTVVEGYVGNVVNDVFAEGKLSPEEWDMEMERFGHTLNEVWSTLDETFGYTAEVSE